MKSTNWLENVIKTFFLYMETSIHIYEITAAFSDHLIELDLIFKVAFQYCKWNFPCFMWD